MGGVQDWKDLDLKVNTFKGNFNIFQRYLGADKN